MPQKPAKRLVAASVIGVILLAMPVSARTTNGFSVAKPDHRTIVSVEWRKDGFVIASRPTNVAPAVEAESLGAGVHFDRALVPGDQSHAR